MGKQSPIRYHAGERGHGALLHPLHEPRIPVLREQPGERGLVNRRASEPAQLSVTFEHSPSRLQHHRVAELASSLERGLRLGTYDRLRSRDTGFGGIVDQCDLAEVALDDLGRRKAEPDEGLEALAAPGDRQQRGIGTGQQHVVASTADDPPQLLHEPRRLGHRIGGPEAVRAEAGPVSGGGALAGRGSHRVPAASEASACGKHGALLPIRDQNTWHTRIAVPPTEQLRWQD